MITSIRLLTFICTCLASLWFAATTYSSSILDGSLFRPKNITIVAEYEADLRELNDDLLAARNGNQIFPYQKIGEWLIRGKLRLLEYDQDEIRQAANRFLGFNYRPPAGGPMLFASESQFLQAGDDATKSHAYPIMSVQIGGAVWLNKCNAFVNPLLGNQMTAASLISDTMIDQFMAQKVTGEMTAAIEHGIKLRTVLKGIIENTMKRDPGFEAPRGLFTIMNLKSDYFSDPDRSLLIDPAEFLNGAIDPNAGLVITQRERDNPFGGNEIQQQSTGTMLAFGLLSGTEPIVTEKFSFTFRGRTADSFVTAGGEFAVILPCVSLEIARASKLEVETSVSGNVALVSPLSLVDTSLFAAGFYGGMGQDANNVPVYQSVLSLDPNSWLELEFRALKN